MAQSTKNEVFLSFAGNDLGFTENLVKRLSAEGVGLYNSGDISSPVDPDRQIEMWVRDVRATGCKMIVICSPSYLIDDRIAELINGFNDDNLDRLKTERPLIPILTGGSLPAVFSKHPFIDFSNEKDYELSLRQLIEALDITNRKTGISHHLKALTKWIRSDKTDPAFKDDIAEIYRLLGFEVEKDKKIEDLSVDIWAQKPTGGFLFQMMIHCSGDRVDPQEVDELIETYRKVRTSHPITGCMLITGEEFSSSAKDKLVSAGVKLMKYPELLASLAPMESYVRELIGEFEDHRKKLWRGEDWFIRPDVKTDRNRERHVAWEEISLWLGGKQKDNLLALLGDLGTGKSTLADMLAYKLGQAFLSDPLRHPAPVLVKLLNVRQDVSLESIIITHFRSKLSEKERDEFSFDRFEYLVRQGRIVLLFDAFDEMAERVHPQVMRNNLRQLIRPSEYGGKVLITSRTHYFKTRDEQESLLGKEVIYLEEFTDQQVQEYLAKARPETKEEEWKVVQKIYNLKELVRRPLLLDMVVREMPSPGRVVNAATLYAQYAESWFDREVEKQRLLNKPVKMRLMRELAWKIWDEEKHSLHFNDLLRLVEDLKGSKTVNFGQESIDDVAEEIRTASFLRRDEDGYYSFADGSFGEYFLACHLYECLKKPRAVAQIRELLRTRRFDWRVIFFLEKLIAKDGADYQPFRQILTDEYDPQVSENALEILYWSGRVRCDMEESITDYEVLRKLFTDHIPYGAKLSNAKLNKIELEGINLIKADFSGANLNGANLNYTFLEGASFRGAILTDAKLEDVTAPFADFREADLSRSAFIRSSLAHCNFTGVIHRDTVFEDNDLEGAKGLNAVGTLRQSGLKPTVQQPPTSGDQALVFDSKGELYASAGLDGLITIYRVKDDRLLHVLEGHRGRVLSLQFSPSGALLISGGADGTVRLWSVSEGRALEIRGDHKGRVNAVTFSPNGRLVVSGGDDRIVRIWSVDKDQVRLLEGFQGHLGKITSLCVSSDGAYLVSASESGRVRLWDIDNGSLIHVFHSDNDSDKSITTMQFSYDGAYLATGDASGMIRLWSVKTGGLIFEYREHENEVASLHFTEDGNLLTSGSKDCTVGLWTTRERFAVSDDLVAQLGAAQFNPKVIEKLMEIKDRVETGEDRFRELIMTKIGNKLEEDQLQKFVSYIIDKSRMKQMIDSAKAHEDWVRSVRFLPDGGRIISGSADRQIRLWTVKESGLELAQAAFNGARQRPQVTIRTVRISPDGQSLANGCDDHSIHLWSNRESKLLERLIGHEKNIRGLDWSRDGRFLASGSDDKTAIIWSLEDGKLVRVIEGHKSPVISVSFSPDGVLLATGGEDHRIGIWLVNNGQLANWLKGHDGSVTAVKFSPDGSILASAGDDRRILLWSAKGQNQRVNRRLENHTDGILTMEFSKNGSWLASGGKDKSVRIWRVASGQLHRMLEGHIDPVTAVKFFPDNSRIASGSEDGMVQIWDVNSGALKKTLPGHLGKVYSIDIMPNGKYLVTAGTAGRLQYWNVETGKVALYRYVFDQQDWLDLLPDGRFNASPNGRRHLFFTEIGELNSHSAEILMSEFYDPAAVKEALELISAEK